MFPKDSLLYMGPRTRGLLDHALHLGRAVPLRSAPRDVACLATRFAPSPTSLTKERSAATSTPWSGKASPLWRELGSALFVAYGSVRCALRWVGSHLLDARADSPDEFHFGKPYLEGLNGAIVAGVVLGSLSMRTSRASLRGIPVHVTVALSSRSLALSHRHALPHTFWAPL